MEFLEQKKQEREEEEESEVRLLFMKNWEIFESSEERLCKIGNHTEILQRLPTPSVLGDICDLLKDFYGILIQIDNHNFPLSWKTGISMQTT